MSIASFVSVRVLLKQSLEQALVVACKLEAIYSSLRDDVGDPNSASDAEAR